MNEQDGNENLEYQFSQYLDGQLSPRAETKLKRRLAEDGDLSEELRRYTALNQHLQAMGRSELEAVDYDAQRAEIYAALERKALLEGPPRRRLVLRPVFAVSAIAAAILILASAGLLTFRLAEEPAGVGGISVSLRAAPLPQGQPELAVKLRRLDVADLSLSPLRPAPRPAIPAGTVMVSAGPARAAPTTDFPTELFGI